LRKYFKKHPAEKDRILGSVSRLNKVCPINYQVCPVTLPRLHSRCFRI